MPVLQVQRSVVPHEWEVFIDGRPIGHVEQLRSGTFVADQDKEWGNCCTSGLSSLEEAVAVLQGQDADDQRRAATRAAWKAASA